ncbi:hypothetical protein [Deinococcus sp. RM]|uniref:hypothetical protein n=1 Tax=Deinococcus sp. RM TaxID=2316359 RepID=UPI000E6A9483|nr:hypothetical protein [Deinococcus sp. RM]RIY09319.1 hypothetical protein D3W47_06985 [Deinococcus sp. RM]
MRFPASALLTATLTAVGFALTGPASAQAAPAGGFQLPADYFGRFGSTQLVANTTDGFGVRYLPLPLKADLRLTLVKAPTYTDYGLSAQLGSLYAAAGVFYNVPRAELTNAPASGLQWSGVVQGGASHSHFSVGYATQVDGGKVRFLNNVGVAQQGGVTAPYTQSEVSAAYGRTFDKVNTAVYSTARMYAFPVQGKAQGSLDVTLALNAPLAQGLALNASHFERFTVGEVAISDFGLARAHSTSGDLTYRLPNAPGFGLGAVRARASRDWTGRYSTVDGDVMFRVDGLPVLIGPSVGYVAFDAGAGTSYIRYGLVTLPR